MISKLFNKKVLILLLIVTVVVYLVYFGIPFTQTETSEGEYQMSLATDDIVVVQHIDGGVSENLELKANFDSHDSEEHQVTIPQPEQSDSIFLTNEEPNEIELYDDGELIISENFDTNEAVQYPEITTIEDRGAVVDQTIEVDASENIIDYPNSTDTIQWDMGDGTVYNESLIQHSYDSIGDYTVTLTASNETRETTNAETFEVSVEFSDMIREIQTEGELVSGNEITFLGPESTTEQVSSIQWSIDGVTYNEESPTHVFDEEGAYSIEIVAVSGAGDVFFDSSRIVIEEGTSVEESDQEDEEEPENGSEEVSENESQDD